MTRKQLVEENIKLRELLLLISELIEDELDKPTEEDFEGEE